MHPSQKKLETEDSYLHPVEALDSMNLLSQQLNEDSILKDEKNLQEILEDSKNVDSSPVTPIYDEHLYSKMKHSNQHSEVDLRTPESVDRIKQDNENTGNIKMILINDMN